MITHVQLLALPASSGSVLYGFYDVLCSLRDEAGTPGAGHFDVQIVSPIGGTFRCHGGVPVEPTSSLDQSQPAQVVVVPDLTLDGGKDPRGQWPQCTNWLFQQHALGAVICSVCTGSVLLADSGLLDEKEATTHWAATELFETYFPQVKLRPEETLVAADASEQVLTAGGGATWEELTLYLVRRYYGHSAALRIAKLFLLGDRSGGQLPYMPMLPPRKHRDAVVAESQRWIAKHCAIDNPVSRMVEFSHLPERTFKRRFHAATGYTPVAYVQAIRIEKAKAQLETTDLSTEQIASNTGYLDAGFFRRLFKRRVGLTPAQYRRRFQTTGALTRGPVA